MRWALLTALHANPGDAFVRVGIERMIRMVDPAAEFTRIHKDSRGQEDPQPFDRAVVCGMPLFWSYRGHRCYYMAWWRTIADGWLCARPRHLMLAGVGSFAPFAHDDVADPDRLQAEAKHLAARCRRIYVRDEVANRITGLTAPVHPCPAVFAAETVEPRRRGLKLCNLMPDGGHYREYGQRYAEEWDAIKFHVAAILRAADFEFVAHCDREVEFAEHCGWQRERIHADTREPQHLLSLYAGCVKYFGNRVHGAIVARSVGADTWVCGYDSRVEAAALCGAHRVYTFDLKTYALDLKTYALDLKAWSNAEPDSQPFDVAGEMAKQLTYFKELAEAE